MIWLRLSAAMMVATAIVHSLLGERRLIGPILAIDSAITRRALSRQVLRMAWHMTSLFMALTALLVLWPGTPPSLILATGMLWVAVGLIDGVVTRGRHVGWGPLTIAGGLAVAGALS